MDKSLYFSLMRETSDIADEIIVQSIDGQCNGSLDELVKELPLKRANSGQPKSRPAIFRFSYELAGGNDWRIYESVAAGLEMLNLSTYVLNYVLDDKGGKKPKQQRNNECMAAMILREIAQELFDEASQHMSFDQFKETIKRLSLINKFTSGIGQYLDGNDLRRIEDSHVERYIQRCEGLTGKFMQYISEIGGILAGANDENIMLLGEFGKNYGTMVQIINDFGDYLPQKVGMQSVGKVYQDQYSDLRHGCLTFPAYVVLTQGTKEDKELIQRVHNNLSASPKDCIAITNAFIRLDGVKQVRILASKYAKQGKKALHHFDKSDARDFLSTSLSMYRTNRFYNAFKSIQHS